MISLASMMSISNLSTIGFLEDEEDDYNYWSVRSPFVYMYTMCMKGSVDSLSYIYMYQPKDKETHLNACPDKPMQRQNHHFVA